METLQELDILIFQFINRDMSNFFFDYYLPILRSKYTWIPVYVFILTYFIINFKKQAWHIILFIFITVSISDIVSSHLIKKNIKRVRPCNSEYVESTARVRCGSGYSFTSSHAANHFALSFFLIFLLKKRKKVVSILLVFWASLVSFSEVYVGVHYPLDVICGGILGVFIAWFMYVLYTKYRTLNYSEKI